jgi:hypothetical protein
VNRERRKAGPMRNLPRGLVFSETRWTYAGTQRGPGLITPRSSSLLASVVGARSFLALLLFAAS